MTSTQLYHRDTFSLHCSPPFISPRRMIPLHHAAKRTRLNPSYICLSCRQKSDSNDARVPRRTAAQSLPPGSLIPESTARDRVSTQDPLSPLLPAPANEERVRRGQSEHKVVEYSDSLRPSPLRYTVLDNPTGQFRKLAHTPSHKHLSDRRKPSHRSSWLRFHRAKQDHYISRIPLRRPPELVSFEAVEPSPITTGHIKDDVNAYWFHDARRSRVLAKKDERDFNANNLKKKVPRAVREAAMEERAWNTEFQDVLDKHWAAAAVGCDEDFAADEEGDLNLERDTGALKYTPFGARESESMGTLEVHLSPAEDKAVDREAKGDVHMAIHGDLPTLGYIPFASESCDDDNESLSENVVDGDEAVARGQRSEIDDSGYAMTTSMPSAATESSPSPERNCMRGGVDEEEPQGDSFAESCQQSTKSAIEPDVSEQVEESETAVQELLAPVTFAPRRNPATDSYAPTSSYTSNLRPALFASASLSRSRPRLFHTTARVKHEAAAAATTANSGEPPVVPILTTVKSNKYSRIRQQFQSWQELNGNPQKPEPIFDIDNSAAGDMLNSMTRLPDINGSLRPKDVEEDDRSGISQFSTSDSRDGMASEDSSNVDSFFLSSGDLVELEFTGSERNSILAIFIRRIPDSDAQFFTMQGRWIFMKERGVMWSIPRWASKAEIAPLLEHLPSPGSVTELEELRQQAQVEDMSVPRSASGPLIKRLVKFFTETQEIYRKHASVLDDAHSFLAHETDLRYGSLVSAAATLLQIPARELPVTALYAVRTALSRAPLAFNVDRRSHRLTGYLQIRSKEQVRMVQYVRSWLRDWQDDIAKRSQLEAEGNVFALRQHVTKKCAQHIYSFLHKARKIVLRSREDRKVPELRCGNIGPSQKRFSMEDGGEAVRVTTDTQFTEQDMEIVRFLEAWCASGILHNVSSYAGLPPMILQATGLYENFEHLDQPVGFMFLQELGVLMPYENRVRFDQHLLLPSSQHSKPLQTLMDSLIKMQDDHQFTDSMKGLRKDWRNLPVYCVDDANAQEIDDGVSIERVEGKEGEYWLHAHVANPTAFFERDHPLAKMARHMGESIYMPERAYMMLPRWATGRHFSLAKDRPCLTFSSRVDTEGQVLERQITSGIVRNVFKLTPSEVTSLLGERDILAEKIELTVGGDPPSVKERKSMVGNVTEEMAEDLKNLKTLSDKLNQIRFARGGVFLDTGENDISVWQNSKGQGLAWDHPYRHGSRTVEGDPVIQLRTSGFDNWFAPKIAAGVSMVREMMLLAGETAAIWCSERGIPTVFRGTVARPDDPDADAFYRDVVGPAVQKTGEIPTHLGVHYFSMLGRTALRTSPLAHRVAGLQQYVKSTSPLRRYGDMIVHWQIEAALREEAKLGRSLTPADTSHNASFLPFSANVLETIMLGLQPREVLITRSKTYARVFWMHILLFRAHHFGECELPFAATTAEHVAAGKPLLQVLLHARMPELLYVTGVVTMLNISAQMAHPLRFGLEAPVLGDTWEVEVEYVDVYRRTMITRPIRLVDRPVDENLERWKGVVL